MMNCKITPHRGGQLAWSRGAFNRCTSAPAFIGLPIFSFGFMKKALLLLGVLPFVVLGCALIAACLWLEQKIKI
jgi:hypothetical protein